VPEGVQTFAALAAFLWRKMPNDVSQREKEQSMNPLDIDKDGKLTKDDAVSFYKQFPFYVGIILGVVTDRVFRLFFF